MWLVNPAENGQECTQMQEINFHVVASIYILLPAHGTDHIEETGRFNREERVLKNIS